MAANGVNKVSSQELAKAGISMGDITWLRAMRNSPVSRSPLYQRTLSKVKAFVQSCQVGGPVPT